MDILDASYQLLIELTSFFFVQSLVFNNIIEKFPAVSVLHDQIKVSRSFYYLIKLDDIWVSYHLQDMNFSRHPLNIRDITNFFLPQNFDCYFQSSLVFSTKLDFSKSALANGLPKGVRAHYFGFGLHFHYKLITYSRSHLNE